MELGMIHGLVFIVNKYLFYEYDYDLMINESNNDFWFNFSLLPASFFKASIPYYPAIKFSFQIPDRDEIRE